NRNTGSVAAPSDCRAILARLASAMELAGGMRVETGWTVIYGPSGSDRLEAEIESALERGARERERYAFFSTLGHELRTPLTSIRGYLETLLEDDLEPKTARRFLEIARHEAMRMGRLVDGMFDISMLDLREEPGYAESCDLAASIGFALGNVAPAAAARGTSITHLSSQSYPVAIGGDRLIQVLINVIENAVKHGREHGRVYVSNATLDTRYIEVRVDDDGPGIPAEEREAIFTLARRGTKARAAGSGLGLAVVRLMLERIGGEVDATSSLLGGAQFRIRLPLMLAASADPVPAASERAGHRDGATTGDHGAGTTRENSSACGPVPLISR
ncbi:MAG: HAMP domain-containing histidine kinase, partial [Candidatus Eremiobacteraeota bacterium]|nr:HAMP domain-containing histidine kinase [Candidatus Eremiobacteraeota bacterium]